MLDLDKWQEILNSLSRNKLRTSLTAISVAWGIFMLIILLGSGNGLMNGVKEQFTDYSTNAIWIRPGQTSIPFEGIKPGRKIKLTNADYHQIKKSFPEIDHISSQYHSWKNSGLVTYKDKSSSLSVISVHPEIQHIEYRKILSGRFINQIDVKEIRKVVALGTNGVAELF
ncbi:MAG: ABC transporter permease, partial [Flavobacteriales bacterium]|nr:ABC transporter permease [Flavobacteriales bacterium]